MTTAGSIPALMDDAKWAKSPTRRPALAAARPSPRRTLHRRAPGNTEVGEGEITMAAVQQHLDARSGRAQADGPRRWATRRPHRRRGARQGRQGPPATSFGEDRRRLRELPHRRYWYPE
jgi:hypothetical protein